MGGDATTTTYRDARGLVERHIDANQVETAFIYDPQARLRTLVLPTMGPVELLTVGAEPHTATTLTFEYQGSFKTSEQDRNGVTWTYEPTPRGLVKNIERLGAQRTLTYDAAGNLIAEQDWAGASTFHDFDALSQHTRTTNRVGDAVDQRDHDVLGNA